MRMSDQRSITTSTLGIWQWLDGDDEEVELSMQEETWHLLAPNFKTVVTDEEFVELGPR